MAKNARRTEWRLGVVVGLVCLLGPLLFAQVGGGGGGATAVIQSAEANVTSGVLTITGANFGTAAPVVTLAGASLTLLSFNNTQIVAAIPSLLPKVYLLSVTKGGAMLSVKFEVTIEAGDVSGVTAGTGLNGGGLTGDLTLAVNTNVIQARVNGACAAGSSIQSIDAGGNVVCESDDVGSGASLGANTFTGTQTIDAANLDLDPSTATTGNITKNGTPLLHTFANQGVFLGLEAGNFTMNSCCDVGIGWRALRSLTFGVSNTAVGLEALPSNTTGNNNTAVGQWALQANSTGHSNVAVGMLAGSNATNGSNNIYLGANVLGVAGESNTMYLGKVGTQTRTVIAGVRGTDVTGGEMVVIDVDGRLGSAPVGTGANTVGSAEVIDESLTATDLGANSGGCPSGC